jgi:L-Ala-D/L-Glu epimerase
MQLSLRTVALPLKHVFRTAHGAAGVQESLLVELREDGFCGYGEGASPSYCDVTPEMMRHSLEAARGAIESQRLDDPAALWDRLAPGLMQNRFALAALDEAAHDLWGKKLGQPVYRLWGLDIEGVATPRGQSHFRGEGVGSRGNIDGAAKIGTVPILCEHAPYGLPVSNYTIGIDTIEKMVAKMAEYADWPIFKIKLGTPDDLKIVRELRRHTSAVFRVDANCAWTATQAIVNAPELKTLGVEFIEQPLAADDWAGMRLVFSQSVLPVIADESCQTQEDVDRCHGSFHGINIKLCKCGGMTPARRMIDRARTLGMKVMIGCMTESTVGISAIGQFLPLLDYVDMDGAELIAQDVATGVRLEKGRAVFPAENGNGVRLL